MPESKDRCWERLASVIEWSNMSINHFAHHIGLRNGENLYQIKRGNHGISRKLAERILEFFPQINLLWLLTGSGDMFTAESALNIKTHFYDVDIETNINNLERLDPCSTLMLPARLDVDFAMLYMADAMGDQIPTNSVVMVKKVEPEQIIFGKEYLVVTPQIALLRSVRGGKDESSVRLVAVKDKYDDITIARGNITAAYRIVAKLIINY